MQCLSKLWHDGARRYMADVPVGQDQLVTSLGMRLQRAACCPVWFCNTSRWSNESQGIISALQKALQEA